MTSSQTRRLTKAALPPSILRHTPGQGQRCSDTGTASQTNITGAKACPVHTEDLGQPRPLYRSFCTRCPCQCFHTAVNLRHPPGQGQRRSGTASIDKYNWRQSMLVQTNITGAKVCPVHTEDLGQTRPLYRSFCTRCPCQCFHTAVNLRHPPGQGQRRSGTVVQTNITGAKVCPVHTEDA